MKLPRDIGDAEEVDLAAIRDLHEELHSSGVTEETLSRCLKCNDIEDVLLEELPLPSISELIAEKASNVINLTLRCLNFLEASLRDLKRCKFDGGGEELEVAETIITNSVILLTRVLSCTGQHSTTRHSKDKQKNSADNACVATHPKSDALSIALWKKPADSNMSPAGGRLVNVAMNLLFLEDFTIQSAGDSQKKKENDGTNKMRMELLWKNGVTESRMLVLAFLATILSGGAPVRAAALIQERDGCANGTKKPNARTRPPWYGPLGGDFRALEYLSDPSKQVPFRSELFYSLLLTALSYNPDDVGIPFPGFFTGTAQEDDVALCLQVLGLLLVDAPSRRAAPASPVFPMRKPQEKENTLFLPIPTDNVFGAMLWEVSSAMEMSKIADAIIRSLGAISREQRKYLPMMQVPTFLPELLNLAVHLVGCDNFVQHLCAEGDLLAFVEGVVQVGFQAPQHVPGESLWLLTSCALLRLTSYRKVCLAINVAFKGRFPDSLPFCDGPQMT